MHNQRWFQQSLQWLICTHKWSVDRQRAVTTDTGTFEYSRRHRLIASCFLRLWVLVPRCQIEHQRIRWGTGPKWQGSKGISAVQATFAAGHMKPQIPGQHLESSNCQVFPQVFYPQSPGTQCSQPHAIIWNGIQCTWISCRLEADIIIMQSNGN